MDDLAGKTLNHWTILGGFLLTKNGWYADCRCSCGKQKRTKVDNIVAGRSKSCGHTNGSWNVTHGQTGTPTYRTWAKMIERTTSPACKNWPLYGGRGIVTCDRWRSFENFLADMGEKPSGTSIDRIDVNGNYEPGNCRWADAKTQARNQRKTILLTHQGETLCLADWADRLGMAYRTLHSRLKDCGWDAEKALGTPVEHREDGRNHFYGKSHTNESKAKMRANAHAAIQVTCPHCGVSGGKSVMKRWHFDRCRKVA